MATTAQKSKFLTMIITYFRDFKVLKETKSEYWGVQIINFLDCTAYFALLNVVTLFLSEDIGFNDKNAGYVITIFTSATTLCLFVSGLTSDWLGIKKSLYVAMGGNLLLRFGVAFLGLAGDFPHRGLLVAACFFLMAPFMAMVQTVFQASNKRFTTKRSRGAGFNLWYLFMNLGAMSGGFLVDIIRKSMGLSNSYIILVGGITGILCTLTIIFMVRREEQLKGPEDEAAEPEVEAEIKVRKSPIQIAKEVLSEPTFYRFLVLIALTLGVRAVFTYIYLLMPKFWIRVIGPDAAIGSLNAINPFLIVIGLILFIPLANKFNIFKMLTYGSVISGLSIFALVIPWQWISNDIVYSTYFLSIVLMVILSIGEVIWSPKLSEYTAAIAPRGQEGTYLGLSMIPWFLAKTIVSAVSGHMLARWAPKGIGAQLQAGTVSFWDSPSAMWLYLGIVAVAGPLLAIAFSDWLTKGARWKTE